MTDEVYQSFLATKRNSTIHQDYPKKAGIYALFLVDGAKLPNFGQFETLVYIGIAKRSLHNRDFAQHFRSGKSGSSTLRRSLGAILKDQLNLVAVPRGGEPDSKKFENYKFTASGEQALTRWMEKHLDIGYWIPAEPMPYDQLRKQEEAVTISCLPVLDLDPRTRKYNKYAVELSHLRRLCKIEAYINYEY